MIWKRTRTSHQARQNTEHRSLKQADLDMLEWAAAVGEICLKYLDESGFCCWSPVGYSLLCDDYLGWVREVDLTAQRSGTREIRS